VGLGHGIEEHVALDAGDLPVVLVFQVVTVGEAEQLHRERILARPEQRGDVKLGRCLAALGEAGLAAVHPEPPRRLHAAEMQHDAPATLPPGSGHGEGPAVRAHGVVVVRHVRRIRRIEVRDVGVDRDAEALRFPVAGHADAVPAGEVGVVAPEADGPVGGMGDVAEAPGAVERLIPGRALALPRQSVREGRVRDVERVGREAVAAEQRDLLELGRKRCLSARRGGRLGDDETGEGKAGCPGAHGVTLAMVARFKKPVVRCLRQRAERG